MTFVITVNIIVIIMPITTKTTVGTPSISAMELRRQPGTVLDRVYYRGESVIVERSGEPRAVIVPLIEYEQIKKARAKVRKRLFSRIDKMRKAFEGESPKKVEKLISQAIKAARNESLAP